MVNNILIYNNGVRVKKTSQAYDIIITHELMRMYLAEFSLLKTDSAVDYIDNDSEQVMFLIDGQYYDMSAYDDTEGSENSMTVSARHIGYRLLDYTLPANYAFSGTLQEVAQDMLDNAYNTVGSRASASFSIGTCPNIGTISVDLANDSAVTVRYAILALQKYGAEMDFDNYVINFAEKIGDGEIIFRFGYNLEKIHTSWSKENGKTREIAIADLQQIEGHEGDLFDIGYNATIIGNRKTFTDRIITYKRCLDNPTKNTITLGVFINDFSMEVVKVQIDVDNRVKINESYNSVKMSHTNGFESVSGDGLSRTLNAGTTGNIIQFKNGGVWVNVVELFKDSGNNGTVTVYNNAHTQKTELGGAYGLQIFKYSGGSWVKVGGMDANGEDSASRITMPGFEHFYAIVGKGPATGDGCGLFLVDEQNVGTTPFFKVWYSAEGNVILQKTQTGDMVLAGSNGVGLNAYGSIPIGPYTLNFKNGMLQAIPSGSVLSGSFNPNNVTNITVTNGMITSVT